MNTKEPSSNTFNRHKTHHLWDVSGRINMLWVEGKILDMPGEEMNPDTFRCAERWQSNPQSNPPTLLCGTLGRATATRVRGWSLPQTWRKGCHMMSPLTYTQIHNSHPEIHRIQKKKLQTGLRNPSWKQHKNDNSAEPSPLAVMSLSLTAAWRLF